MQHMHLQHMQKNPNVDVHSCRDVVILILLMISTDLELKT